MLNGFQERGKIPINFPKDLCLFKVGNQIYSAGIRYEGFKNETNIRSKNTVLFIFIRKVRFSGLKNTRLLKLKYF